MEQELFQSLADAIAVARDNATPKAEVYAWFKTALGEIIYKYLPTAGDAATLELGAIVRDHITYLEARDREDCAAYGTQEEGSATIQFSPHLVIRELAALEHVIRSGAAHEGAPASEERRREVLQKFWRIIMAEHGPVTVLDFAKIQHQADALEPTRVCQLFKIFYDAAMALPPQEAVVIIKLAGG